MNAALRGLKPPSPGVPSLATPLLAGAGGEAVDGTALSYLLHLRERKRKEEEEERKKGREKDKELAEECRRRQRAARVAGGRCLGRSPSQGGGRRRRRNFVEAVFGLRLDSPGHDLTKHLMKILSYDGALNPPLNGSMSTMFWGSSVTERSIMIPSLFSRLEDGCRR